MISPLGQKLNARRRELKISLERLALMTDSSKSYLWELENRDKTNPSADKIAKIAAALDVTPEFLLNSQSITPDQEVADKAFFRKYQQLDDNVKTKVRKLIDVWSEED